MMKLWSLTHFSRISMVNIQIPLTIPRVLLCICSSVPKTKTTTLTNGNKSHTHSHSHIPRKPGTIMYPLALHSPHLASPKPQPHRTLQCPSYHVHSQRENQWMALFASAFSMISLYREVTKKRLIVLVEPLLYGTVPCHRPPPLLGKEPTYLPRNLHYHTRYSASFLGPHCVLPSQFPPSLKY
ncbi:uncharacterized protein BDZ83DRAFT_52285 [Colletotrichum acutatum]|uniref:Uncharacterized protein n=1 Tax=Glomerella acutata TaxID=27357 RepID=A0AAD8XL31_GLOAC|nr:uncharacterized protein BDZ83DRAFT_52285 [Colletotrichum acutatum]KAK1729366.1 hypothetical protein BDZ83DRAFT_52285 [Colletotrichum acutatum]